MSLTKKIRIIPVIVCALFCCCTKPAYAQQDGVTSRYAVVIGNSHYTVLGSLRNPSNDAIDVDSTLRSLGFQTELLLNADLIQMENAVVRLKSKLAITKSTIGLFYYAGHGVQSNGNNYLIPSDSSIQDEAYLRIKALSTQSVLDVLQQAGNSLNIIVLDACRDNPFGWARSGSRGLSVVGNQPPGSIVVYATGAGSIALDGTGRNGVFTAEFLKYLPTPGIDVNEIFMRTGAGVQVATAGKQTPAVYNQFFGSAYLAGEYVAKPPIEPLGSTTTMIYRPSKLLGSLLVSAESAGTLYLDGSWKGELRKGGALRLSDLEVGYYDLEIRYPNGENETKNIRIKEGNETSTTFTRTQVPQTTTTTIITPKANLIEMVFVKGGEFWMGSPISEFGRLKIEGPEHKVSLSSYLIGKYEVTQEQYHAVMNQNPSTFSKGLEALKRPVERVTWYEAVAFCNTLSEIEGLDKVYKNENVDVHADFTRNGYRLPTEAEWEYAARGGSVSRGYLYSGSNDVGKAGWYVFDSGSMTHPVGTKSPNEIGIFDMSGNVWEWCWDWNGNYSDDAQKDPEGPIWGEYRIVRGGSWYNSYENLRSPNREYFQPKSRSFYLGFRVARRP